MQRNVIPPLRIENSPIFSAVMESARIVFDDLKIHLCDSLTVTWHAGYIPGKFQASRTEVCEGTGTDRLTIELTLLYFGKVSSLRPRVASIVLGKS